MRSDIDDEFKRHLATLGGNDPYAGDTTIGLEEVLRAHFLLADHFAELGHGLGGVGVKDWNMLHSALSRQSAGFGSFTKWTRPVEVAATLFYGLVTNHSFYDANKRTALLIVLFHLQKIGRLPKAKQREFEKLAVDVADHRLSSEYPNYSKFKRHADPEVAFIADFLRSRTRDVDNRHYAITFNQLQGILAQHGFALKNPHGNYIDVVKIETKMVGLFRRRTETHESRLAQIGFPGWKSQVTLRAMKTVREATGLTTAHGVDSGVFYHDADRIEGLIAEFEGALKRLAKK